MSYHRTRQDVRDKIAALREFEAPLGGSPSSLRVGVLEFASERPTVHSTEILAKCDYASPIEWVYKVGAILSPLGLSFWGIVTYYPEGSLFGFPAPVNMHGLKCLRAIRDADRTLLPCATLDMIA